MQLFFVIQLSLEQRVPATGRFMSFVMSDKYFTTYLYVAYTAPTKAQQENTKFDCKTSLSSTIGAGAGIKPTLKKWSKNFKHLASFLLYF